MGSGSFGPGRRRAQQTGVVRPGLDRRPALHLGLLPARAGHRVPGAGTPQWFGPGADWAPPAPRVPATLANAVQASTYGLLIVLAVGGLVTLLSPFLLAVGLALSSQVRYRRSQVRLAFIVALGVSLASGAVPIATGQGIDAVMGMVGVVSLLACWVMIAVVTFLQYTALAAGERPDAAY